MKRTSTNREGRTRKSCLKLNINNSLAKILASLKKGEVPFAAGKKRIHAICTSGEAVLWGPEHLLTQAHFLVVLWQTQEHTGQSLRL